MRDENVKKVRKALRDLVEHVRVGMTAVDKDWWRQWVQARATDAIGVLDEVTEDELRSYFTRGASAFVDVVTPHNAASWVALRDAVGDLRRRVGELEDGPPRWRHIIECADPQKMGSDIRELETWGGSSSSMGVFARLIGWLTNEVLALRARVR